MKRTLVLCVLLLAVPAAAEFTAPEKIEVLAQVNALYDAGAADYYILHHLSVRPQDAVAVHGAVVSLTAARETHMRGLLYLLDVEGGFSATVGGMTRTQSRSQGLSLILGASASYSPTISILNALTTTGDLTTAKQLLQSSESRRLALNETLAYEEPRIAVNISAPGATRLQSTNAGPHGDYRRFGEMVRAFTTTSNAWIREASLAGTQNSAFLPTLVFTSEKMSRIGRFPPIILGLLVGVEHSQVSPDIDIMFAGGTTLRGRHFWRMRLVQEMLLGWDHLPPVGVDVFGRVVFRGLTYELVAACRAMNDFAAADATVPQYARSILTSSKWICESWAPLDSIADNTIVFRFSLNTGPPGQVVGICGANTNLVVGPPPTCVGTGGGGVGNTCGTGTHLVGTECLPDPCPECPPPPACPTFTPVLDYLSDRIQPRCVEIQ